MPNYPLYVPVSDSQPTVQASGQATGPGAGITIASVTVSTPGVWQIWVHYYFGGTGQSAGDLNNMRLQKNTTDVLNPMLIPALASNALEDLIVNVLCTTNDVITVKTIGAGTGTVIYNAMIVAKLINGNAS